MSDTLTQEKLKIAKEHYSVWLEAEINITTHQSYTIGSRTLTLANLSEVRRQINYWENKINEFENVLKKGGRNRVVRAVPRDL